MAVQTRYVVIRTDKQNKEQEIMTFTDKRAADDYDKMLDMADSLYPLLEQSGLDIQDAQLEELSIFLAKQREDVLVALQAKKKPSSSKTPKAIKKSDKNKDDNQADLLQDEEEQISVKSLSETLIVENQQTSTDASEPTKEQIADDKLVDFVIEKDEAA